MLKHEIRKLYLQKRKALSDQKVKDFNQQIKIHFNSFLPVKVRTVHVYLPIRSKGEIDTWSIIQELWAKEIQVVAPVMDSQKNTISSHLLTEENPIVISNWIVPEPEQSSRIQDSKVDAIVVPLLAFDKKGYRVGYGKGYYDRYIASLGHKVLTVGLSFFTPIDIIADLDSWDVPLDYCITPGRVFKF
jgi:5-formyltetrahydrofolate cyclo-ligase